LDDLDSVTLMFFFTTVNQLINQGKVTVPPLGNATDLLPCPTLRDFFIVDQDPDDGVQTLYLVTPGNHVIQKTQANMKKFFTKATLANLGDNRILTKFINPAIGCATLTIPDAADPGVNRPALPLNVIQALLNQNFPIANIPNNDPMTTTNGQPDLLKMNLFRMGVDETPDAVLGGDNDPVTFCRNYAAVAVPRFKSLAAQLMNFRSPSPQFLNLFDFMKNRAIVAYTTLNCANLTGTANPFTAL